MFGLPQSRNGSLHTHRYERRYRHKFLIFTRNKRQRYLFLQKFVDINYWAAVCCENLIRESPVFVKKKKKKKLRPRGLNWRACQRKRIKKNLKNYASMDKWKTVILVCKFLFWIQILFAYLRFYLSIEALLLRFIF